MAAHGHLDALHLSLWLRGVAMVIDPGTGAYHADKQLRNWLASASAHNVVVPILPEGWGWPKRLGPFMWSAMEGAPQFDKQGSGAVLDMVARESQVFRSIKIAAPETSLIVEDDAQYDGSDFEFAVRWQFAPASRVEDLGSRRFRVTRLDVSMEVQVSADWAEVWCVMEQSQVAKADPDAPLAGTVSPAFRETVWAPYLKLVARPQGDKPCVFNTAFLAFNTL